MTQKQPIGEPLLAGTFTGEPVPSLDRLAALAARALHAPVVLAVVVGDRTARVVGESASVVLAGREVSAGSFAHRVAVGGACADPAVLAGTWEAKATGAQAALGVPIITGAGGVLGALLALDPSTRAWTPEETAVASMFARVVSEEIERLELEIQLKHAERLRAVLMRSPEAILVHVDGMVQFANPAAVALLGGRDDYDVVGRPVDVYLAPPYLKKVEETLLKPGEPEGPPPVTEERLTRLDGSTRYVEVAALGYVRGDAPAVQLFLRDITERRKAREALRAREAQLRLLLERLPVLYWTTDSDLRMLEWRPDVVPASAGPDHTVESFFGLGAAGVPVTTHRAALSGVPSTDILAWRGSLFEIRVEPLRDDQGEVTGTVGVALDTTLRRRAEEADRSERELEAVGRLAGGVAHGVNNALATIVGLASIRVGDKALSTELVHDLDAILHAGAAARDLTAKLLGFARQGRYRLARIDLNAVAAEVGAQVQGQGRAFHQALAADLPIVEGDPQQVYDAVLHVCQNACEATAEGGHIRITTSVRAVGEGDPVLKPGVYVCLELTDTGAGMTDAVRAQALEPFFTTKELGKGLGLGLSMAFGVMRHHGGDLRITSERGVGTTVSMYLPVEPHPIHTSPPSPTPPHAGRASAPDRTTVLVIDDDEWVRYSSAALLEALEFDVAQAEDGPRGLAAFEQHRDRILFVLLDLRMPGMDGEEVLRRLVALDPEVHVIICTGYDRDQVSRRLFALGHVGFLGKPFTLEELEAEIARVCLVPA